MVKCAALKGLRINEGNEKSSILEDYSLLYNIPFGGHIFPCMQVGEYAPDWARP